ncbi:hypothetical protein, partial [Zoogloea sp.]|uniref:hypothetical protein n=1 Tax=Zoogloea sp. TaxID=49181 RepID=UPI00258C8DCE
RFPSPVRLTAGFACLPPVIGVFVVSDPTQSEWQGAGQAAKKPFNALNNSINHRLGKKRQKKAAVRHEEKKCPGSRRKLQAVRKPDTPSGFCAPHNLLI